MKVESQLVVDLRKKGINLSHEVDDATAFRLKQALDAEDDGPVLPKPVMVWRSADVDVVQWEPRWIELWRDAWGKYTVKLCCYNDYGDSCGEDIGAFECDNDTAAKRLACMAWAAKLQGVIDEVLALDSEEE